MTGVKEIGSVQTPLEDKRAHKTHSLLKVTCLLCVHPCFSVPYKKEITENRKVSFVNICTHMVNATKSFAVAVNVIA